LLAAVVLVVTVVALEQRLLVEMVVLVAETALPGQTVPLVAVDFQV
jgi:hypothetical protein